MPPLLARYLAWFDASPVLAALAGLALLLLALILLRVALKLFLILVVLLLLALAGSYLCFGEDRTEEALERGMEELEYDEPAEDAQPPRRSR